MLVLRNPLVFVMVCHVHTLISTVSLVSILNQKYRSLSLHHFVDLCCSVLLSFLLVADIVMPSSQVWELFIGAKEL